jgi:hypothetical protein
MTKMRLNCQNCFFYDQKIVSRANGALKDWQTFDKDGKYSLVVVGPLFCGAKHTHGLSSKMGHTHANLSFPI